MVFSLIFHYIPIEHRGYAVGEMFRVLPTGGRMVITEVRPESIPNLERLAGVAHGHTKAGRIFDHLHAMTTYTGIIVVGTGNVSRLCYLAAPRPQE